MFTVIDELSTSHAARALIAVAAAKHGCTNVPVGCRVTLSRPIVSFTRKNSAFGPFNPASPFYNTMRSTRRSHVSYFDLGSFADAGVRFFASGAPPLSVLNLTPAPLPSAASVNSIPTEASALRNLRSVLALGSEPRSSNRLMVSAATPALSASSSRLQPASDLAAFSCSAENMRTSMGWGVAIRGSLCTGRVNVQGRSNLTRGCNAAST